MFWFVVVRGLLGPTPHGIMFWRLKRIEPVGLQLTDRRRHELLLLRQITGSMEEILFSFSMCSITFLVWVASLCSIQG
jgi:hypothetical protein